MESHLVEILGGRQGVEEVKEFTRVVLSETKSLEDTFEYEHVTRDTEGSFLVVSVFLGRFVEQIDEHWVVEELRRDYETLHLVSHVHRDVSFRDHGGGGVGGAAAAQLGSERAASA